MGLLPLVVGLRDRVRRSLGMGITTETWGERPGAPRTNAPVAITGRSEPQRPIERRHDPHRRALGDREPAADNRASAATAATVQRTVA
jgi:hypothetical protein